MSKLKKLIEARAKVIMDAQALADGDTFGADEQKQFDAMMASADDIKGQITALKRAQELSASLDSPVEIMAGKDDVVPDLDLKKLQSDYNAAFDAYLRNGNADLSAEQKQVLRAGARKFSPQAAQEIATDAKGGHTVPTGFISQVEVAMAYYNAVRESGATILNTSDGRILPYPTLNGTTVKGRRIGEGGGANTQDIDFDVINVGAHTYTSDIILVSNELLQDTAVDLIGLIAGQAGERIGRITNEEFTVTGAGTAPGGIVNGAANSGVTFAATNAVTYEELLELKHSVDIAYRKNPSCGFMLSDPTLLGLAKLKDNDGRPLLLPSIRDGEPDTILGKRYTVNPDMDDLGAGKKAILFGAFDKYLIRDVSGGVLKRLDERYADDNQTAFLMFTRHDGQLIDAGTGPIKYATCAAE